MKYAVVTGAANGIGKEISKQLIISGVSVFLIDKDKSVISVSNNFGIKYNNARSYPFVADISDYDSICMIKDEIQKISGGIIDYLINNAGFQIISTFDDIKKQDWDSVIDTNLNGTFNCSHIFGKIINDGGRIVNISSIHAEKPRMNNFSYDASKAGMNIFTKEMALVFAERQITVNCVEPGAIDTPMNHYFSNDVEIMRKIASTTPLGRIGTTIDVANLVMFLLSEKANFITGTNIAVDGGRGL